jgi:tetratricopeptide (TPR) repeat protein
VSFDVFVSYRHNDTFRVRPIVDALRALGLAVWIDEREINDFSSITGSILEALSAATCLVAYYSADYPRSRACQWELTAAFVAAQQREDPRRRIVVINPESAADHIYPVELRDALFRSAPGPDDSSAIDSLAAAIARHVSTLKGALGEIRPFGQPAWYGLRGVSASRFVGRLDDLWRIHSGLHAAEVPIITQTAGPAVVQITGLGGTGKSVLAEEYALRFGAGFPAGVFWLRAYGSEDKGAGLSSEQREAERGRQMLELAAALGVPVRDAGPEPIESRLARKLAARGESFLWVVDDFPAGQNLTTLRQWIAPHPLGRTIVTSRSREYQALGTSIALGQLDPGAAYQLLTMHRKPVTEADESAARDLIRDLGCLALAIEVAGSALAAYAGLRSFADFRHALNTPDQDELELAQALTGALPSDHETSVASTLSRSIKQLDPPGLDLLRLASVLAASPIPAALAAAVFREADGLDEAAARRHAAQAIHRASQLGLVERGQESDDLLSVHALVSRTMRFGDSERARRDEIAAAAVRALVLELSASVDPRTRRNAALLPHAWELASAGDSQETTELMTCVGNYAYGAGAYGFAAGAFRRAWESNARRLGETAEPTLLLMRYLGVALLDNGEFPEARRIQERHLTLAREVFGEEHLETLRAIRNLALTLIAQDELASVRELQQRDIEGTRRLLGEDAEETLSAMHNLAITLTMLGDTSASQELDEHVLAVRRRVLGEDHPDTLKSIGNLAVTLQRRGDLARARTLHEEALARCRRLLGEDHRDTLQALRNLGTTLRQQRDLSAARALCAQASAGSKRVLGDEHPLTLMTLDDVAGILDAEGHFEEARAVHEQVLAVRRRVLGEQHLSTFESAYNLALALRHLGRHAEAVSVLQQALSSRPRSAGNEDLAAVTAMHDLAWILGDLGDHAQARTLYEQVLAARRRLQGLEHKDTLATMDHLAWVLRTQGDLQAAAAQYRELLAIRERVLGREHADTTTAAWRLYYVLSLSKDDAAGQVLEQHLGWLLAHDKTQLTHDQRNIRAGVRDERRRLARRRWRRAAFGWLPGRK